MNKSQLKKIFKIEGYILDKIEDTDNEILLHCHLQSKFMKFKNERSKIVNQTRIRKIAHAMMEFKKVFIVIEQRRFYFPKNKTKLWESLPQVAPKQQCTTTFKKTLSSR